MGVRGIDHINIRTLNPESSAHFYQTVLGFEYRKGPVVMGNQSHWLFDEEGNAVIHFRIMEPGAIDSGTIDHIALRCADRDAMKVRLDACGVQYSEAVDLIPGVAQVFLRDPHGVAIELNFVEPSSNAR